MAILNILKVGDDTLRKMCRPIEKIDKRILTLLDDMRETMKLAKGVGLAASQVGVLRRIVLVNNGEKILELINPEIIKSEETQEGIEACLSVPGKYGTVKRPMKVIIKATDRNGKVFKTSGEGLIARAFCHEIDHLNGILFIDIASEVNSTEDDYDDDNYEDEE